MARFNPITGMMEDDPADLAPDAPMPMSTDAEMEALPLTPEEQQRLADQGLTGNVLAGEQPPAATAPSAPTELPIDAMSTADLSAADPRNPAITGLPAPETTPGVKPPTTTAPLVSAPTTLPGLQPIPDLTGSPPTGQSTIPDRPAGARQKITSTELTKEDAAVAADRAKLTDAAAIAEKNASVVRQQQITDQQKFDAKQALEVADRQKQLDNVLKEHQQRLDTALARDQAAYNDVKDFKFHDYWSTKSTGDRLLAALAAGLGGYSAGLTGGRNQALDNINAAIDRDFKQQEAELRKRQDLHAETSKGIDRAISLKSNDVQDLQLKKAAATESAAVEREKMMRQWGIPEEQIKSDKTVIGLYEGANKERQDVAQKTKDQVEWDTWNKAKGAGSGGGGAGTVELVKMAEQGQPRSAIVAAAQKMNLPEKLWKNQVDLAFSEREKGADRRAGAEAKRADEDEKTGVRDESGNVIGHVPSGRGGAQAFATRDSDYARAQDQLEKYLADLKTGRAVGADAVQRRNNLHTNAAIGVATVSPLGKTNESIELEKKALGSTGALGLNGDVLLGPNTDAVERKIEEIKSQRDRYKKETLIPVRSRETPSTQRPEQPPQGERRPSQAKLQAAAAALADPMASIEDKKKAKEILYGIGR